MADAALTTLAALQNVLSEAGVTYRLDDAPPDSSDGSAVEDASQTIYEYCLERYSEARLAASSIVAKWAKTLGAFYLCRRRGNTPPTVIKDGYDEIIKKLERVQKGTLNISDTAQRRSNVGVLSSPRVTTYPHPRVVIEKGISTGTAKDYKRHTDRTDILDYQI